MVAPEGTVVFENKDCDTTDTIEATVVAAKINTTLSELHPNSSLESKEWCTDGKLVIK